MNSKDKIDNIRNNGIPMGNFCKKKPPQKTVVENIKVI